MKPKVAVKLPAPWQKLTIGKDKHGKPRAVFVNINLVAYLRGLAGGGTKLYFVAGDESLVVEETPEQIIPRG
jgi:hypothetical protein